MARVSSRGPNSPQGRRLVLSGNILPDVHARKATLEQTTLPTTKNHRRSALVPRLRFLQA